MANRKRSIQLHFMVSERERELIEQKMAQMGTRNMGAYLRKMAVDGYRPFYQVSYQVVSAALS